MAATKQRAQTVVAGFELVERFEDRIKFVPLLALIPNELTTFMPTIDLPQSGFDLVDGRELPTAEGEFVHCFVLSGH